MAKLVYLSVPELHGHIFGSKNMAGSLTRPRPQVFLGALVNATTPPPNSPKLDSLRHLQKRAINTISYAMS